MHRTLTHAQRLALGGDAAMYRRTQRSARPGVAHAAMDAHAERLRAQLLSAPGPLRAQRVRVMHRGGLFDLYAATVCGAPVILKRPSSAPRPHAKLAVGYGRLDGAMRFGSSASALLEGDAAARVASRSLLERLLWSEAKLLAQHGAAWNHGVIGAFRWRAGGRLVALTEDDMLALDAPDAPGLGRARGALCVVMPRWDGQALNTHTREQIRGLYPALMLSLWDALVACPHRRLTLSSLMLTPDARRFRLLGAGGVVWDGTPQAYHQGLPEAIQAQGSCLTFCATEGRYYPLWSPLHAYTSPTWTDIRAALERNRFACEDERAGRSERIARPCVPDMIAMGLIYAEVLTGRDVRAWMPGALGAALAWPDDCSSPPVSGWICRPLERDPDGGFYFEEGVLLSLASLALDDPHEHSRVPEPCVDHAVLVEWLEHGLESALLCVGDVMRAEASLCARLVRGDVASRGALIEALVEVMEASGAEPAPLHPTWSGAYTA